MNYGIKRTQDLIDIIDINDNILILKEGTFAKIVKVSPINYSLKSSEEQESIMQEYANFLKEIKFDFQILVKTKKENMEEYLNYFANSNSENSLLYCSYIEYIKELIQNEETFIKAFYIIIKTSKEAKLTYNEANKELKEMYEVINRGLRKCGNLVYELENYGKKEMGKVLQELLKEN